MISAGFNVLPGGGQGFGRGCPSVALCSWKLCKPGHLATGLWSVQTGYTRAEVRCSGEEPQDQGLSSRGCGVPG